MKVSIIVPVYNVAEYITECFNSVASQTFTGGMECIFVDDCGTDDSVDIVRSLISLYHGNVRFRVVNHDHNKGLSAARNTGLREATGNYVYFLDSDDSITPECISLLAALAEKYPGVDMVQGNNKTKLQLLRLNEGNLPEYSDNKKWIKECCLTRRIPMTAWNRLVRRDFLLEKGLLFEEGMIHEDELWTFFLAKHLQKLAFCFEDTYVYRVNPNGIMSYAGKDYRSSAPVVSVIASNLEKPQLFLETKYMMGLISETLLNDDDFMRQLCGKHKMILWWYKLMKELYSTTKWSFRGIFARIKYNVMPFFYKHDMFI